MSIGQSEISYLGSIFIIWILSIDFKNKSILLDASPKAHSCFHNSSGVRGVWASLLTRACSGDRRGRLYVNREGRERERRKKKEERRKGTTAASTTTVSPPFCTTTTMDNSLLFTYRKVVPLNGFLRSQLKTPSTGWNWSRYFSTICGFLTKLTIFPGLLGLTCGRWVASGSKNIINSSLINCGRSVRWYTLEMEKWKKLGWAMSREFQKTPQCDSVHHLIFCWTESHSVAGFTTAALPLPPLLPYHCHHCDHCYHWEHTSLGTTGITAPTKRNIQLTYWNPHQTCQFWLLLQFFWERNQWIEWIRNHVL